MGRADLSHPTARNFSCVCGKLILDSSFSFVIGLVGAIVAIWGIHTQPMIARRRATFDHIAKSEADADLIQAKRKFVELAKHEGGLAVWAQEDKEKSGEVRDFKHWLWVRPTVALS